LPRGRPAGQGRRGSPLHDLDRNSRFPQGLRSLLRTGEDEGRFNRLEGRTKSEPNGKGQLQKTNASESRLASSSCARQRLPTCAGFAPPFGTNRGPWAGRDLMQERPLRKRTAGGLLEREGKLRIAGPAPQRDKKPLPGVCGRIHSARSELQSSAPPLGGPCRKRVRGGFQRLFGSRGRCKEPTAGVQPKMSRQIMRRRSCQAGRASRVLWRNSGIQMVRGRAIVALAGALGPPWEGWATCRSPRRTKDT